MSIIAALDLVLSNITSTYDLISTLKKAGWSPKNTDGMAEYLPIGDADQYNWLKERMTDAELKKYISQKEKLGERSGIRLFYMSGSVGITLLTEKCSRPSFLFDCNRVKTADSHEIGVTDINWYMERIVGEIKKQGINVESLHYDEY